MQRKDGRHWGEAEDDAFLAALAAHRHVGRAAAAIGWSSRTAYARRRADPQFAARWAALGRPAPSLAPGHVRPARVGLGGVPARATFVRGQNPWTDAIEEAFLDMLASTSNVRASCQAVGIGSDAVYRRRRNHPEFERKWDAALAQGYARLEMETVRAAAESIEGVSFTERAVGPVTADQAIKLIGLHRAAVKGEGKRPGGRPQPPSIEQVLETVRRRAAAIRAARPRTPDEPDEPPHEPA